MKKKNVEQKQFVIKSATIGGFKNMSSHSLMCFFISNKYSDQNTKQDEQINMLSPHINRGHNSPAGGEKEFLG